MATSIIPESAPFNEEQRAWLNGFLSGLMGLEDRENIRQVDERLDAAIIEPQRESSSRSAPAEEDLDEAPWHDVALPIAERMQLAEGKPLPHRLMAAMAQLDCGSCGYDCKTYSAAIASQQETNLTLCSPGGQETKKMLKKLLREATADTPAQDTKAFPRPEARATVEEPDVKSWSRQRPFPAKLLESRPLNKQGSAKDTRHVVIDLSGSGLQYNVGDALGIYPVNCRELVDTILARLELEPQTLLVRPDGSDKTLVDVLCEDCCLKAPSDELLELLLAHVDTADRRTALQSMLDDGVSDGTDVLDVLDLVASRITAIEFVESLNPLNPRLYSIASSQWAVGESVHLTVGKVVYERGERMRKGVASCMLADPQSIGMELRVFVQPNHASFTVPADPSAPMIMIGPGTGIAPFMAFLQERAITKAPGPLWLFFGDQHQATDFLYENELAAYCADGVLTRLDTAFSRDGETKVYVQDRMREKGAELWQWLQAGAHVYVCGDAARMAPDVGRALKAIVREHGKQSDDQADSYWKSLAAEKRYVRDVY